jgi:hypothetical protein
VDAAVFDAAHRMGRDDRIGECISAGSQAVDDIFHQLQSANEVRSMEDCFIRF